MKINWPKIPTEGFIALSLAVAGGKKKGVGCIQATDAIDLEHFTPRCLYATAGIWMSFIVSGSMVVAQQNLIVNGGFESGGKGGVEAFPGWDLIGPASNHSNYGVAAASVAPDIAAQGNLYAYFHGHPTDNSQDCLGQTVSLTAGERYTISYLLATDGPTLGSGAAMYVVFGTSFGIDYSQDQLLTAYLPNSSSALPYQKFTTTVTARESTEILSFHGFSSGGAILLDGVSITLVVPPVLQVSRVPSPSNALVFSWTTPTPGFQVQANASPLGTNWVTLTNAPVTVGISNRVVLPVPSGNQFYRLVLP